MKDFRYRAYGITFETPFPCPLEKYTKGIPQVKITYGTVPNSLDNVLKEGVLFQVNKDEFLFKLNAVATYWVQNSSRIVIHPVEEASIKDIRVFLFSSVFGYILQKRGFLTLHANAVRMNKKGLLIAGNSGAGKTTLSYSLINKGAEFLVDDISSVSFDKENKPHVAVGLPRLKLWKDALNKLGKASTGLENVRSGLDKYEFPLYTKVKTQATIHVIIILSTHNKNDFIVKKLSGSEKFNVLKANTYRYQFLAGEGISTHFSLATQLANEVEIYKITRPNGNFLIDELSNHVLKICNDA